MIDFCHATKIASFRRRICVPRLESGSGTNAHLWQDAGLRGIRGGFGQGETAPADAGSGLVPDAKPLALCALAAQRWRSVGVHAMADGHAYATLARRASHGWNRSAVPGPLQVVPHPRGRSPVNGAAVCGAESLAGESGGAGRGVALVKSLASGERRCRVCGRRTSGAAAQLAAARAGAGNRCGVGGLTAFGAARRAVWRDCMAGANGKTIAIADNAASSRSAAEIAVHSKIRLPTPLSLPQRKMGPISKTQVPLSRAVLNTS